MPVTSQFDHADQQIWGPHRAIATELAETIYLCRFEANQDRKAIDHFERGKKPGVTTGTPRNPLHSYHSSLAGVWNWRACHYGNVTSSFGATNSPLETRLVFCRSWDR